MFRTISCIISVLFLSGCGLIDSAVDNEKPMPGSEHRITSISPEARRFMEEAVRVCADPVTCGDPDKASELLDMAVEADPLDPSAYVMRGWVLSRLGYYEEAFNDLTKAIRMNPSAEAYAARGLVCTGQNSPEGAERDFDYAVKMNPNEPMIYVYRASSAFLKGEKADGCGDLEKACRLGVCTPLERAKHNRLCR